ncbi:MAG: RNA polymerase sigma factor [Candidatus Eisenbacteria sp.]|nr:RNA polymerase sigma factor [Candidatus Eisenbacteria bacterium]
MGTTEDRELAGRAAAGEEKAWREIYDRTRDRLFALLSYHLGNRDEAMDVLQDTFVHAIQGIHRFSGEGSLEGWLAVIAIRRATDWKRRFLPRLKRMVPFEEARAIAVANPRDVEFTGEGRRLKECLARLSHRQRTALLLREFQELSFAEIGEALGCKEATARVHHLRARERMQALLKPGVSGTGALCAEE